MFCAVARFFRPGYHNNLIGSWLPALDGVVEKLERGAKVADVGCGHGWSTVTRPWAGCRAQRRNGSHRRRTWALQGALCQGGYDGRGTRCRGDRARVEVVADEFGVWESLGHWVGEPLAQVAFVDSHRRGAQARRCARRH
jgi:hypothetical protein